MKRCDEIPFKTARAIAYKYEKKLKQAKLNQAKLNKNARTRKKWKGREIQFAVFVLQIDELPFLQPVCHILAAKML